MDDLDRRINAANNKYIGDEEEAPTAVQEAAEEPQTAEPVDVYYERSKARQEASKRAKTNGSPASLRQDAEKLVGRLKGEYKRNKAQYDDLYDTDGEELAQFQADSYMENAFLPTVEALTAAYGPDAVLANKEVLRMFDELVISRNGGGDGYTEAFIKTMDSDERGQVGSESDTEVTNTIRKIRQLNAARDIRSAVGLAENLKKRIDSGELSANDEDYALLVSAVSR